MNLKFNLTYQAITAFLAVIAFFLLSSCLSRPVKKVVEESQIKPVEDMSSILFEEAEQAFEYGNNEIALMKYQL